VQWSVPLTGKADPASTECTRSHQDTPAVLRVTRLFSFDSCSQVGLKPVFEAWDCPPKVGPKYHPGVTHTASPAGRTRHTEHTATHPVKMYIFPLIQRDISHIPIASASTTGYVHSAYQTNNRISRPNVYQLQQQSQQRSAHHWLDRLGVCAFRHSCHPPVLVLWQGSGQQGWETTTLTSITTASQLAYHPERRGPIHLPRK
jgi:hypothetical protein